MNKHAKKNNKIKIGKETNWKTSTREIWTRPKSNREENRTRI